MKKDQFLVVGMSPGNGYFKQEVIDKILDYTLSHYENIGIFIPDVPAVSTYIALGYPENIARAKKAIPQGNNFKNRVLNSIEKNDIDIRRVTIFDWQKEGVEDNPAYRVKFDYLKNLYSTNKEFEKDINEATQQVLVNNPFKKKEIVLSDIIIGTHYILSEFAFMLFLQEVKNEYKFISYGYHKPWDVWEKFITGVYDGLEKPSLKFVQLPDFSGML